MIPKKAHIFVQITRARQAQPSNLLHSMLHVHPNAAFILIQSRSNVLFLLYFVTKVDMLHKSSRELSSP